MYKSTRRLVGHQSGFTIIETLVVIAVSGLLLVSAVLVVAGKQRKVEFNQAAQDMQSVIQQVLSETSAGHYSNAGDFSCSANSGGVTINNGTTEQGSNTNCIFLGRAIQFGNAGKADEYVVHTIAGFQGNDGTLVSARPTAIDRDSARQIDTVRNGLEVVKMRYVDGATSGPISGVAFLQGLGKIDANNNIVSGSQQMSVVPLVNSGSAPSADISDVVNAIDNNLNDTTPVNPDGGVQICLASGGSDLWAQITIGSKGGNNSATLSYKSTVCW
jgi:prepilin-type N-terminal cleavage/methylation domain-containing protein